VKISGNPSPPSLHTALFQGIYSKIIDFCMERDRKRIDIEVRTDKVDSPIAKDFYASADELVNLGTKIKRVTGYDPALKKVVARDMQTTLSAPALPITVENLKLNIVGGVDGLVVAADVLANSLYYLFRNRPEGEKFTPLNSIEAVANHPLWNCLDAFRGPIGSHVMDNYYAHPLDPRHKRSEQKK
jgi:hypothetical protein